ncbi:MAG: DNA polymerase III subunit beta [Oscillospiraceae bacterium]|nr:DNA polymerase III subunit beta [Oscillospiraceae bacterium]
MKFIIEKSVLQNAVLISSRAVPSKSPITALEGLMIEAGTSLTITGYDLKKAIYSTVEAEIEEPGIMVVNARFFAELIRRLPDGMITIVCDDNNNINVKCGKSEYNISGLDFSDYPEMPQFNEIKKIEIPQNVLANMINRSLFAVSKEEIRPIYTGTLFEIEEDELTLVSVDGYRLARRIEKIESSRLENCSFVVPGFALSDIEKICESDEDPAVISVGEKHISFTMGSTVVITRRLEGDFLNHRKSVPENFRFIIKVDRQEILSAIDRVSLVLSDKTGSPVRMRFEEGTIDCKCVTPVGKAEDICLCEGSGEGIEIGFNDKYLLDALKAAEKNEILFCLNTPSSPCIIKAADGTENFTYMILPVRLHT